MKKIKTVFYAALTAAALFGLGSCLNPLGVGDGFKVSIDANVSGQIDTADVTAASTYIVNMSKTLDFTDVLVRQPENRKLAAVTFNGVPSPYLVSQFGNTKDKNGRWKIIKTKYVQASDIEYEVELNVKLRPETQAGIRKSADVYATQSKGVYYVWLYRTDKQEYIDEQIARGVDPAFADIVVASPNDPNMLKPFPSPKPGDTIDIDVNVGGDNSLIVDALQKIANILVNAFNKDGANSPEQENGSVPPVISPANRTQMGTFVVVNLSRTRNVDWVSFFDEGRTFNSGGQTVNVFHTINSVTIQEQGAPQVAFPAVAAQDRRGIALLQGQYKVQAGHNGTQKTAFKTGLIVPSNDPQTIREHYMYFYKDRGGSYVINTERPGNNDIDPADVLPPDQGSGVGRITLVNKTSKALLESVSLEARDYRARGSLALGFDKFNKKAPVGVNASDNIDVTGTPQFPVDGYFIATVNAATVEGTAALTRLIYLNNTIAEIIVTDSDVNTSKIPGARITVSNNTSAQSFVHSIRLTDSRAPAGTSLYAVNVPNSPGSNTGTFDVYNSAGMPIIQNETYTAQAVVTVINGYGSNTGTIAVSLSPQSTLYGAGGPASCLRTIAIGESDISPLVPQGPSRPAFVPVTNVIITNNDALYENDGSANNGIPTVKVYGKGRTKSLEWAVSPGDASNTAGYWTFGQYDAGFLLGEYGLGADGRQHTDDQGRLTVSGGLSAYYSQFCIAFVIPNGREAGARTAYWNSYGPFTGLFFDPVKDFVKVFNLKEEAAFTPPPPPARVNYKKVNFVNGDTGWSPGVEYLVLYRINDDVNLKTVNDKGWPAYLEYYLYGLNGGLASSANNNLDRVFPRRLTTGDTTKWRARPLSGGYEDMGGNPEDSFETTLPYTVIMETLSGKQIPVVEIDNSAGFSGGIVPGYNFKVKDSIVIKFRYPLNGPHSAPQGGWFPGNPASFNFDIDKDRSWALCWIGAREVDHLDKSGNGTLRWTTLNGTTYSGNYSTLDDRAHGGYSDIVWFILRPGEKTAGTINLRSDHWKIRYY